MKVTKSLFLLLIFLALSLSLSCIQWQTWQYGDIRVKTAPKDSAYSALIVKTLHQKINAFQMKLGVYPTRTLQIVILPNRSEYNKVTQGKGKIVQSSEAFYAPHEGIIYVRSPEQIRQSNYDVVLMHEYIHWFLDETMENVPLWFHEGMAYYYSGQYGYQSYYNFVRYRFLGYKISLNDMVYEYPADRNYWEMFYLTSAFAISYLEEKRQPQWQAFWDIIGFNYHRDSSPKTYKIDFIKAFNVGFRTSLYTFSKDYDKTLRRYGWQFPLIGINAIIFSLLPIAVLIAWFKSRRRMKSLPELDLEADEPDAEDTETNPETLTEEEPQPPIS